MKINFLLTAVIIATVSSCSTSYKTGQTPDDVYYSPVRLQNNEVRKEDDNKTTYDNSTVYDSPIYTPSEDREIRRRINSRRYRRNHDRYNYPYGYNNYPPVYTNPKNGTTTKTQQPRTTNLGGYSSNTIKLDSTNYNPKTGKFNTVPTTSPARTFGTPANSSSGSNNGTTVGNAIRKIFSGNNSSNNSSSNNSYNNGNSNNSSPSRTFESRSSNNNTPSNSNSSSTSSSSSSSSSSGTSAPVRTFKKD